MFKKTNFHKLLESRIYVHIWKSLNACMLCNVNTALKQQSRLSTLSALKTANIPPSICVCERPHIGLSPNPLSDGWAPQWMCVCTLPLLTDRSHWQSRWRLRPCDPQPRLRTNMTQAAYWRGGGCLERRPCSWCVCQCLWDMPLCLPINLKLIPLYLYPESPVTAEDNTDSPPFSSDAEQLVWCRI